MAVEQRPHYLLDESGPVLVNERVEARMRIQDVG